MIKAIPNDVDCPEIFYEDDGDVSLDWSISKKRALSISVTPDLLLQWAWLIDDDHGHHTEQFTGQFSELLLNKLTNL